MSTLDTVRNAAATFGEKVRVTPTSLEIDDDLDFDAWTDLGGRLGLLASSSQWWIGDWLVEGHSVYGKRYETALIVTGLDYGTLRNYRYVCERVDSSLRNDNLGFHHHVAVAPLTPAEQKHWLDRAERDGMSVVELREAIAGERQLPAAQPPAWKLKLAEIFNDERESIPLAEVKAVVTGIMVVASRYVPPGRLESFMADLDGALDEAAE